MLYLIRFEIQPPNEVSLSKLRDSWLRGAPALPGSGGSGIIESFKVVGQQTVFAVARFDDNEALDETLARLPIVEEFGSAVDVEVILVRPFDSPEAREQAPAEEPTHRREGVGGYTDSQEEIPARAEEPVASEKVAEEPEESAPQPEVGQVSDPLRAQDTLEQTPASPEEPGLDATAEMQAKTPEQPETSVTGLIRGLDTPGRAPIEPGDLAKSAGAGEKPASTAPSLTRISIHFDSQGEISFDDDLISLGRDPDNHVVVADSKASRRHAMIQNQEGTYWINDLGSQNGTRVNEDLVTERRMLVNGDVIRIGDTRLVFGTVTVGEAATEEGRPTPAQPEDPSITGVIRNLDADNRPPQ
jgi:muconolactone delta-isomerase